MIIGIGSAVGGGKSDSSAKSDSTASQTAEASTQPETTKEADKKTEESVALGTATEVGDFSVTISEVTPGITSVGNQYLGAKPQGQYVVVKLTVTNNGKTAQYFTDSNIKLVDSQDREHSSSSDSIYLEDNVLVKEINPGNTLSGTVLFDVPADAALKAVKVEGGLFDRAKMVAVG